MSNIRILIDLIIYCVLIGLPIIFLIATVKNWKNKLRRFSYLFVFIVSGLISGYFFSNMHENRKQGIQEVCGAYVLNQLDCNKCGNCYLQVKQDMTYDIVVDDKIIGTGSWSLEFEGDAGIYFPQFDYGPSWVINKTDEIGINRINCNEFWCSEQFKDEFSGTVIDMTDSESNFDSKTLIIRTIYNEIIHYQAKYASHPMLGTKFNIGDEINKIGNSLKYIQINTRGDTTTYDFGVSKCK